MMKLLLFQEEEQEEEEEELEQDASDRMKQEFGEQFDEDVNKLQVSIRLEVVNSSYQSVIMSAVEISVFRF